jgi:hypothetical protein
MIRCASAAVANSGTSKVVTFMPNCGMSCGSKNRPWMSSPPARPMAAGASPNTSSSVVPRMRCTSDTPTGWCGSTSKKQNTSATAMAERSARAARPSFTAVSKATLPV